MRFSLAIPLILLLALMSGAQEYDMSAEQSRMSFFGGLCCNPRAIAVDSEGAAYITGEFMGGDLQPGPESEDVSTVGFFDSFLLKVDRDGEYQWARAWGCEDWDAACDVETDSKGAIYVVGNFRFTVDFDRFGQHEVWRAEPDSWYTIYLAKFLPDGSLEWVKTWQGAPRLPEAAADAALDEPWYELAIGPDGVINCLARGQLSRFGSSGESLGVFPLDAFELAIGPDGTLYTAGWATDFPPPGYSRETDSSEHHCTVRVAAYGANVQPIWERSWGCQGQVRVWDVSVNSNGYVILSGELSGTADLDPGPAKCVIHGNSLVFVSEYNRDGDFTRAYSWANGQADALAWRWRTMDWANGAEIAENPDNGESIVVPFFSANYNPLHDEYEYEAEVRLFDLDPAGVLMKEEFLYRIGTTTGLALASDNHGSLWLTGNVADWTEPQPSVWFDPADRENGDSGYILKIER